MMYLFINTSTSQGSVRIGRGGARGEVGIMASTSFGEAHYFEESMNATKVRSYLASSKEAEKSKGMKFLLANMSKGKSEKVVACGRGAWTLYYQNKST